MQVEVEWRDAYTLCCLMCAAIVLTPGKIPHTAWGAATASATAAEATAAVSQPCPVEEAEFGAQRDAPQDCGCVRGTPQRTPDDGAAGESVG